MDEERLFQQAVAIESPHERAAFLDRACLDNPTLRQQVESLLRAHEDAGSFLERPPLPPTIDVAGGSTMGGETSLDFLMPANRDGVLGTLGPYEVLSVIGRGGMGIVLKAHDTRLSRIVAIKVLAPELAANATARKRFGREARAAASIKDPHVVTIHAVDEEARPPYLVMEMVDGKSLREKIEEAGALEAREILRIGSQIAAGLAAAHKQGLIHRDVKPANILLENGVERVKITDFGLARASDDLNVTRTGEVAGTPQFMAPEQALGEPVDHRADLFSLGSVLYTMCTGRPPFRADSMIAVIRRVIDDTPRPISEINPEIPVWLCAFVERLMAKRPDDRYQSAAEVAHMLEERLAALQLSTGQVPPAEFTSERREENRRSTSSPPHRRSRSASPVIFLLVGLSLLLFCMTPFGLLVGYWLSASHAPRQISTFEPPRSEIAEADTLVTVPRAEERSTAPPPLVAPFTVEQVREGISAWSAWLGVPSDSTNSVGMKLRLIPPGEFEMGSSANEVAVALEWAGSEDASVRDNIRSESPARRVTLDRPFLIGVHEVTVAQFRRFAEAINYRTTAERTGGGFRWNNETHEWEQKPAYVWNSQEFSGGETTPVAFVTEADADAFCAWLSAREGRTYTLPEETQWEYACRAGTTTRWFFGNDQSRMKKYAWTAEDGAGTLHPAGRLAANAFGLFDVLGNAAEMTRNGDELVFRGGDFGEPFIRVRSASRVIPGDAKPRDRHGFRVAVTGDLRPTAAP